MDKPTQSPERVHPHPLCRGLFLLFSVALTLFLLLLVSFYVLPGGGQGEAAFRPELSARFSDAAGNALRAAVEDVAYIPKIYRIPPGAAAPVPEESGYGTAADSAAVQTLLERIQPLLGEEGTALTPDRPLLPGSAVEYYADDSIAAMVWKEGYQKSVCTFCEVKVADASQIRRKLTGDAYGSGLLQTAAELAAEDHAAASISGDYYAFRTEGTRVWQGMLYRADSTLDTCFFTRSGDMLLVPRNTLSSREDLEWYLQEQDVSFSLSFGPILVEDGENVTPAHYPVGEINDRYARSVVGQLGELHFLLMTANWEPGYSSRCTAREAAQAMLEHGCRRAYALDGGQTATITLGGRLMNCPEFGFPRTVSDILCFATAVPEAEP